ncbi:MAG TPA: hypothetical protein VGP69_16885 [Gaiellaceae bacterium]|jgi:hypothetical protein|nr:hypothetical protein [Gaiellaceae bacterium]
MASTRSNRSPRPVGRSKAAQIRSISLRSVARDGARIQIGGFSAAATAIADWALAADRFVQAVGDELLHLVDGETDSRELMVRVASSTTAHLHQLADHFDTRPSRAPNNN